jgi:uncharacterized protein
VRAWCHRYPHLGIPGPTVGFLSDAIRWFDEWLKDSETGILNEAPYQVFLQDSVRPQTYYDERPGRWIGLDGWPSSDVETPPFCLTGAGLSEAWTIGKVIKVSSPQTTGQHSGEYMPWFSFRPAEELPGDQAAEDAGSCVFDTQTLVQSVEIVGNPTLLMQLSSDCEQARVAARLCDVWPGGASTLITRGILNLSQREGKGFPRVMRRGEVVEVEVALNHVAYTVPVGHKLRLALSTSYWPMAWPAPKTTLLSLHSEGSVLQLPVLRSDAKMLPLTQFGHTVTGEPEPITELRPIKQTRDVTHDDKSRTRTIEIRADNGKSRFERTGMEMGSSALTKFSINESDPLSAKAEYEWEWEYGRGDWATRTYTHTKVTSDAGFFFLDAEAVAWEGDTIVFEKRWSRKFERDHF